MLKIRAAKTIESGFSLTVRVRRVAQQLYEEGLVVDAGSLLLKLQDFHPTVSTLNAAVVTFANYFQSDCVTVNVHKTHF